MYLVSNKVEMVRPCMYEVDLIEGGLWEVCPLLIVRVQMVVKRRLGEEIAQTLQKKESSTMS